MFCDEPLSEFVIVTSISFPDTAPSIVIPAPSLKSKALDDAKSVSDNALAADVTFTPGDPSVADERTSEPSASH